MSDQDRRCLPPCQRQLSDEDPHAFCFECLGEEHASIDLAEAREMDSPLSLALLPDHEAIASVSQARFCVSSERADETSSLASGEVESATSVRSSRDKEKDYEELLEVVTRAVDRLHLDWPQEQETSKRSELDDRYLSGGQGEGPQ